MCTVWTRMFSDRLKCAALAAAILNQTLQSHCKFRLLSLYVVCRLPVCDECIATKRLKLGYAVISGGFEGAGGHGPLVKSLASRVAPSNFV